MSEWLNEAFAKAKYATRYQGGWLARVVFRVENRTPESQNVIQLQLICIQEEAAVPFFQGIME